MKSIDSVVNNNFDCAAFEVSCGDGVAAGADDDEADACTVETPLSN